VNWVKWRTSCKSEVDGESSEGSRSNELSVSVCWQSEVIPIRSVFGGGTAEFDLEICGLNSHHGQMDSESVVRVRSSNKGSSKESSI